MKNWVCKAIELLTKSIESVPVELNELDWKQNLSPNEDRLAEHISAFANLPGGGFFVFGIKDETLQITGINKDQANEIVEKLSNIAQNRMEPPVQIDHYITEYKNVPILFCYIKESNIRKPVKHIFASPLLYL